MTEELANYRLESFFNSNFAKNLTKIAIFKNPDGSYDLFDKYIITYTNKKYYVTTKHSHNIVDFYTLQNAVIYCIFSHKNKIAESYRINELDKIVESVNFSISSLKSKLAKGQNLEYTIIYSGKLSQDEAKRHQLLHELLSYKRQANYWQTSHFRT